LLKALVTPVEADADVAATAGFGVLVRAAAAVVEGFAVSVDFVDGRAVLVFVAAPRVRTVVEEFEF